LSHPLGGNIGNSKAHPTAVGALSLGKATQSINRNPAFLHTHTRRRVLQSAVPRSGAISLCPHCNLPLSAQRKCPAALSRRMTHDDAPRPRTPPPCAHTPSCPPIAGHLHASTLTSIDPAAARPPAMGAFREACAAAFQAHTPFPTTTAGMDGLLNRTVCSKM
jgi:hypothetical protein